MVHTFVSALIVLVITLTIQQYYCLCECDSYIEDVEIDLPLSIYQVYHFSKQQQPIREK